MPVYLDFYSEISVYAQVADSTYNNKTALYTASRPTVRADKLPLQSSLISFWREFVL